jgi:ATP/maltotriose-dependent transcriptional regulator MalT
MDVMSLLGKVQTPTLVLHSRDDDVVPITEGHILAAEIPGAQFIELDSKNHILLDGEPAWERFCDEVLEFMGLTTAARSEQVRRQPPPREDSAFAALTSREREVLALLTEGLSNEQIAKRLSISEKTVRNHLSNLFDKLGVWTRAQAIVFAHDRGFRAI